jgi:hypothetical protein
VEEYEDPHTYYVIQVYDADQYLMDFDVGRDKMKAIEEEKELQEMGFGTIRLELSTAPLFGQPDEESMDDFVYGTRLAY